MLFNIGKGLSDALKLGGLVLLYLVLFGWTWHAIKEANNRRKP